MDTSQRFKLKTSEMDDWSIFTLLDKEFASKIRLACVFGHLGNEAILVSENDEVFGLGANGSGCLGLGEMVSTMFPKKIESLCYKEVVKFCYGSGPHVLALTKSGEVYSWGHNGYCQLGNGTTAFGMVPALVPGLSDKGVVDITSGSHHNLCLTEAGDIFAWGQNNYGQVGNGTTTNQHSAKKISAPFAGKKVIQIACGQTFSMAVLETGEVYGWGYNGNGQLGLGNNMNQLNPCRITSLQGVIISKLVSGYAHTLALSDEGELYSWGANSFGQLGNGNKANSCSPAKVCQDLGRVVDVATIHYTHICAAMTYDGKVFMWGQCLGQTVPNPLETPFRNLLKVFSSFAVPCVTPWPITIDKKIVPTVLDSLRLAFNDEQTSDLTFVIEGKEVFVHKALLKIRCDYFRSMFQGSWKENANNSVQIQHYPYSVYKAFLEYLYTDEVELPAEDAISLLDLANTYCEDQLKSRCELIIKNSITIDNVANLFALALKYQAKDLEQYCFSFSLNHMTAVTQTEAFQHLDNETCKLFIAKAAQSGAFRS